MFLNIDFFAFGAPFWELWGGSWASLGALWASKTAPKSLPIIETSLFFSTFVVFVARLLFFFDLGGFGEGFWEGLGKIWGWLGMLWGRFGKVFFSNASLAFFACFVAWICSYENKKKPQTTRTGCFTSCVRGANLERPTFTFESK